jgi:hypothetical protein
LEGLREESDLIVIVRKTEVPCCGDDVEKMSETVVGKGADAAEGNAPEGMITCIGSRECERS